MCDRVTHKVGAVCRAGRIPCLSANGGGRAGWGRCASRGAGRGAGVPDIIPLKSCKWDSKLFKLVADVS